MTEEEQQAVVDVADAAPVVQAEVAQDAREDDLDAILKEFDEKTAKPEPKPEAKPGADPIKSLEEKVDSLSKQQASIIFKKDMAETIDAIRGDINPEFADDALIRAWIEVQAELDPRLGQAWVDRYDKPKQFEKVKAGLARKFAEKFSKLPDKQATEDREAVTAAIRGASTKAPKTDDIDEKKIAKMSDHEFEQWKRSLG